MVGGVGWACECFAAASVVEEDDGELIVEMDEMGASAMGSKRCGVVGCIE